MHEGSAGRDAVGIKVFLLGVFGGQRATTSQDFLFDAGNVRSTLMTFFGGAETTTTLLIHLGARSLMGVGERWDVCV